MAPKRYKPQPETLLQKKLVAYLNYRGLFAFVIKNTGTYDPKIRRFRKSGMLKGISDIWCQLPHGRFAWIEVKMPTSGRVSKDQKAFIDKIKDNGGLAFVARSTEDLDKHLKEYYHCSSTDVDLE